VVRKGGRILNPKIQKITDEIERLKRKISSSQARLRDLERQKTELENADIIAAVRGIDVPPEELHRLIARLQARPVPHFEPKEEPPPNAHAGVVGATAISLGKRARVRQSIYTGRHGDSGGQCHQR